MQHVHCDSSDNAPLCCGHMHDPDLTVNMLGLCDPSNLLFVLSAEERRTLLKLLWGLVISYVALYQYKERKRVFLQVCCPCCP